ncbi:transposase [Thiocystis violacea]|uniref:transposase n=1 Tax=Thiocystis violacea TaxID=13725 RepID=UPI0019038829|nr:transposase [Thiocystis violacea]MBK1724744.1 hypothetical protein [Thiocystis violacea]
MAAMVQSSLFSWDALEARSDLDRLHLVVEHLPDERLVQYLEVMRGHGRDDYPVRAMWNALLAGIVYQHESLESLLREFARNPSLMQACGFDPLPIQRPPKPRVVTDPDTGVVRIEIPPVAEAVRAVPASWNVSRFLANVIEREDALSMVGEMAVILREPLMAVLPDFGTHLGLRRHRHRQSQHRAAGPRQRSDLRPRLGASRNRRRRCPHHFGFEQHFIRASPR